MENGKNFPPDTIPRIEEEKRETGPPPEAPVPVPLTEAQRRFAAQYHALIYGFLLEKKLEIREYYDIAAIGYLHAVQRYFTEKSLHRYRFSTIAWRSMNSSLNTFRRQEQRRQSHEFSYDAAVRKCQKLRGKKPRNADVGEEAMVLAVKRGFEQAQAKANKPSSPGQNDDKEVNRYE